MAVQLDVIEEFREDHRKVRDLILDLAGTLRQRDLPRARELLGSLDRLTGPHFRFEEEALYPALRQFLGDYVDKLLSEHDGAIAKANGLAELLQRDSLSQDEAGAAIADVSSLLIHVSDCDGLAIIMEKMSEQELGQIADTVMACREADVSLLRWAQEIRGK
ncbi:MAG: hemerythrin domain-containing protein [Dehalococcoidia bacterium]|nr:hemerythrin domain-containing protein [Dehalococcoidia bacterium]